MSMCQETENARTLHQGHAHPAIDQSSQYVPYVHIDTGARALLPTRYDSVNGVLVPLVPTPPGFVPALHRPAQPSIIQNIISSFTNCCANVAKLITPSSNSVNVTDTLHSTRISPTSIRQPMFSDEDDADDTPQAVKPKLSTKALEALSTKLELEDVDAWIVDFVSAVGRVDKAAHALLHDSEWRELTGPDGPGWAKAANERISDGIHSALDPTGTNVKLLKTALREAEAGDRPGILYSGMDILYEIRALVTERSIGEIKLGTKCTEKASFTLGAAIDDSRLVGDSIKRKFLLKPAAEQAAPNALLHEILSKMPSTMPVLSLKKEKYEDDLYKAEIIGEHPPWTVKALIDYIAVDLARASKAEASVSEKSTGVTPLSPNYVCGNCTAKGKHLARDCPVKCKSCNLNFCPGAWHKACAVTFSTPPSKSEITNALDRPLPDFLVAKLEKEWKVKHPGAEVSSLERTYEASSLEYICDD